MIDSTGRRLFFQLVHAARRLRDKGHTKLALRCYLLGMMRAMIDNLEDFNIADSMRGYWEAQQSGAD